MQIGKVLVADTACGCLTIEVERTMQIGALLGKVLVADTGYSCSFSLFARVVDETTHRVKLQYLHTRWADDPPDAPSGRQEGYEVPILDGPPDEHPVYPETATKTPESGTDQVARAAGDKLCWSVWDGKPRYHSND